MKIFQPVLAVSDVALGPKDQAINYSRAPSISSSSYAEKITSQVKIKIYVSFGAPPTFNAEKTLGIRKTDFVLVSSRPDTDMSSGVVQTSVPAASQKVALTKSARRIVKLTVEDDMAKFIYRPGKARNNINFSVLGQTTDSFAELPPESI